MASVWAHAHLHRGPLRCGKEMRGFQSTCKENKERNDIEYGRIIRGDLNIHVKTKEGNKLNPCDRNIRQERSVHAFYINLNMKKIKKEKETMPFLIIMDFRRNKKRKKSSLQDKEVCLCTPRLLIKKRIPRACIIKGMVVSS